MGEANPPSAPDTKVKPPPAPPIPEPDPGIPCGKP